MGNVPILRIRTEEFGEAGDELVDVGFVVEVEGVAEAGVVDEGAQEDPQGGEGVEDGLEDFSGG